MCSPGINGEGELRGQPANPGSPGKMAVKTECVCVCVCVCVCDKEERIKSTYHRIKLQQHTMNKAQMYKTIQMTVEAIHYQLL